MTPLKQDGGILNDAQIVQSRPLIEMPGKKSTGVCFGLFEIASGSPCDKGNNTISHEQSIQSQ